MRLEQRFRHVCTSLPPEKRCAEEDHRRLDRQHATCPRHHQTTRIEFAPHSVMSYRVRIQHVQDRHTSSVGSPQNQIPQTHRLGSNGLTGSASERDNFALQPRGTSTQAQR